MDHSVRFVSATLLRVVHYVSPTAEDSGFCSVGVGLRRLPAFHQEDVEREVRAQSARPITLFEHGERQRGGGRGGDT